MSIYKNPESCSAPNWTLAQFHPLVTEGRTTGNGHHVIGRIYPTGDVDITSLQLSHEDCLKNGGGAKRVNDNKGDMSPEVLQKSIQRARTMIKRKCLTMQANKLLTLTYRENITDLDRAWASFKYFCTLMHKQFPDFKYVAVPEYQQRGAVHFHLAVRGYFNYNIVRLLWRRAVGVSDGNVNFTEAKKKSGKPLRKPKSIAGYIAKYLSKEEKTEFNRRRYSSGGDIQIPAPLYGWLPITDSIVVYLCQLLENMTHSPVYRIWESEGRYPIIHITT